VKPELAPVLPGNRIQYVAEHIFQAIEGGIPLGLIYLIKGMFDFVLQA
jgi:hypothetical protein